jgi:CheY-like chemotaxis protein
MSNIIVSLLLFGYLIAIYKINFYKFYVTINLKKMIQQDLKNARILIVDDLQTNIDILTELLCMDGYLNIETTTNPREVVDRTKSFDPDLILLDLMMPYLSGFDVMDLLKVEKQKSLNPTKYLPILVLTADASQDVRLKALAAGAKDFLSKPFDLLEVRLRIKNLLETQYLFQLMAEKHLTLEEKVITFLKINDEWYR